MNFVLKKQNFEYVWNLIMNNTMWYVLKYIPLLVSFDSRVSMIKKYLLLLFIFLTQFNILGHGTRKSNGGRVYLPVSWIDYIIFDGRFNRNRFPSFKLIKQFFFNNIQVLFEKYGLIKLQTAYFKTNDITKYCVFKELRRYEIPKKTMQAAAVSGLRDYFGLINSEISSRDNQNEK